MPRYKRTFDEAELDVALSPAVEPKNAETLSRLRNMWEFASLMQYIYLFGSVVKIENDFDIEDLEAACLAPQPSEKLAQLGLQLLKYVSSHRGLTPDIFDEYTRRQYQSKAPLRNLYGDDTEPARFDEFDVFTKIRVLQQLSTWTLGNAERIRGMMSQEEDHLSWRIEPIGWDKEDRAYFVLDDDRMYRRSDEPVPPPSPPPKAKAKSKSQASKKSRPKGTRSSKRRKVEDTSDDEQDAVDVEAGAEDDTVMTNGDHASTLEEESGYGFTSKTWECVAITLEGYQDYLATIFRTRDPNEKQLRKQIEENILPIIEKRAEAQRQKQARRMRDIENLQKLATAKRSSRLADKAEKEKTEREEREVEEKKLRDLKMAHDEQERQKRIEEGHESRRLTREQRVKEREVKRILHEEELAKLERASSQDPGLETDNDKRISERQMKTQKEKHKAELEKMAEDDDNWVFDCAKCGVHGENFDDGAHSIACERCNVWQHSKCHGFSPKQAEKEGFHFICATCKRKERREKQEEEDAKKPKIPPLKLGKKASASPEVHIPKRPAPASANANGQHRTPLPEHIARQLDEPQYYYPPGSRPGPFGQITNGHSLSPQGQSQGQQSYRYPPVGNFAPSPHQQPQQSWQSSPAPARPPSSGYAGSPPSHMTNGYAAPGQHQQHQQYQHQQQHQYMHQQAVASSGAHPGYQAPYQAQPPTQPQAQPYPYSQGATGGMHAMSPSPLQQQQRPQYYQGQYQPQHNYQYPATYYQQQQPSHLPANARPVTNGVPSPSKPPARPTSSASPPQHDLQRQPYPPSSAQQHRQPAPLSVSRSPSANFPPPSYNHQSAASPVKSSPPPNQDQYGKAQVRQQQLHPSPQLAPTQQTFRPPSAGNAANGITPSHVPHNVSQTPQQNQQPPHISPAPASANANGVAADGMSGPWPEGSKVIPQKNSPAQAPAGPTPTNANVVHAGGSPTGTNVPTLTPASGSQMLDSSIPAPQSIPVKKVAHPTPVTIGGNNREGQTAATDVVNNAPSLDVNGAVAQYPATTVHPMHQQSNGSG